MCAECEKERLAVDLLRILIPERKTTVMIPNDNQVSRFLNLYRQVLESVKQADDNKS